MTHEPPGPSQKNLNELFDQPNLSEGLPRGSVVENLPANAGDAGSTPGSGRFPERGNGSPLQYSFLEMWVDSGAWGAVVVGS